MNEKLSFRERFQNSRNLVKMVISEMTGRQTENNKYGRIFGRFGAYKEITTFDISRTNYALSRAIFYANLYTDRKTGTEYGRDYLLGAPFGKPIVNIAAAFAVGAPIQIVENTTTPDAKSKSTETDTEESTIDKDENPTISNVNQWLEEKRNFIYLLARNKMRDGDTFVAMEDDGLMHEIPPEDVDIITDPFRPEVIAGYDVWSTFPDPADQSGATSVTYVDEIRRTYRQRMLLNKQGKRTPVNGTRHDYRSAVDGGLEERELPIIHFANEKEGRMLYGISEFQSLYFLMANYHAVLSSAIKGNIYNSTAVPVVEGLKNMKQFLSQNFKQNANGNWELKWDQNKMLVIGEGGSVKMLQADGTASDAQTLLEVLFWLIAQNSETPEFVFGTAVQSSKASVSEQAPLLIKKAIRQQGQLEEPIRKMIDLYIDRMSVLRPDEFQADTQYTIDMPDILDKDLNVNVSIVNALLEKGIITEETAMVMLNIGKYVKNFEEELAKAKIQKEARTPLPTDAFGQPLKSQDDEALNKNKVAKQAAINKLKANPKTKNVGEMMEKYIDRLSLATIQEMVIQESQISVKSGNPYRSGDGKFGTGGGGEGKNPKDNAAAAVAEQLISLEEKLDGIDRASDAAPIIEKMRKTVKGYLEANGGSLATFKKLEENWVGNDYKVFEDAIKSGDSLELNLMHDLSMAYFKSKGLSEVTIYRGIYNDQAALVKQAIKSKSKFSVTGDYASSYTGYIESARIYANGGSFTAPDKITDSVVIRRKIPVSEVIYSTHVSTFFAGNRGDEYIATSPKGYTVLPTDVEVVL